MTIINTCKNNTCSKKETCYRFNTDSDNLNNEKDCLHYWNKKYSPKKQILTKI